jgi:hypothetical protein
VQSGTQWIYELRVFYLCNFPSLENFRMGVTSSCSCQSSAAMPSTTIACALSVDILLFFTVRKTSSLEPQVYIESHWRKIFAIHISLVESNWYWRSAWGTLHSWKHTKRRRKYLASLEERRHYFIARNDGMQKREKSTRSTVILIIL